MAHTGDARTHDTNDNMRASAHHRMLQPSRPALQDEGRWASVRVAPPGDRALADGGHGVRGERRRQVAGATHLLCRRVLVVGVERRCHRRRELKVREVGQRAGVVGDRDAVDGRVLLWRRVDTGRTEG